MHAKHCRAQRDRGEGPGGTDAARPSASPQRESWQHRRASPRRPASKALKTLEQKNLVRREATVIAAGRARTVELLHANRRAERWLEIAPTLARGTARQARSPDPAGSAT